MICGMLMLITFAFAFQACDYVGVEIGVGTDAYREIQTTCAAVPGLTNGMMIMGLIIIRNSDFTETIREKIICIHRTATDTYRKVCTTSHGTGSTVCIPVSG